MISFSLVALLAIVSDLYRVPIGKFDAFQINGKFPFERWLN